LAFIVKTCFFALLLYLIVTNLKFKGVYVLGNLVMRHLEGAKRYHFLRSIDVLIKASAIEKILPFFNLYVFLFITVAIFAFSGSSSYLLTHSIIPSLCAGIIAGIMPKLLLELLRVINVRRVRNNYHGFLCSLIGFFTLTQDIVGSYKNAADYTGEPLRSYVNAAVYKYKKSNIDFSVCLDELADRAGERELGKLIKFTKLYLSYGGDFTKILNKLNGQSQRVEKARLSYYSSAYIGIIAIIIMAAIDIMTFILLFISDKTASGVLGATLLGNGFVLLNVAAVLFALYMSFRLFRGDV